jgi:hypothetical protein
MVAGGPLFTSQTKEYSEGEMLVKPAAVLSFDSYSCRRYKLSFCIAIMINLGMIVVVVGYLHFL